MACPKSAKRLRLRDGHLRHRRDVGARGERFLTRAGEDRDPHGWILHEPIERRFQRADELLVQRVELVGSVQRQRDDRAVAGDLEDITHDFGGIP